MAITVTSPQPQWRVRVASEVLVSCDGNRITQGLIEEVPELWSEQQKVQGSADGMEMTMAMVYPQL